ncbi:MAG: hypothetical protein R2854_01905 [Caldilineaceae bacterium]
MPTHAWYVAYAPYENPEIAIVTFVYDGGEGSAVALPVTQRILQPISRRSARVFRKSSTPCRARCRIQSRRRV